MLADIRRLKTDVDRCRVDKDRNIEKMASLGELAAAVAHDIKNPLAGISGALQVLAEDYADDNPRKEIACEILNEIARLDMSVKDLLVFARPPELNLILTDINAIIEKVADMLKMQTAKMNADIQFIDGKVPGIMVDPEQMEKVLLSISLHCLQSLQQGGRLTFATEDLRQTDELQITVSDTGAGMTGEKLKNIFKPFFSTKHSGTGLGLAISRNVIEHHRGRITVESRVGAGTTFRIILPKKG